MINNDIYTAGDDAVSDEELLEFLKDAELVIHNATFDVGFIEHELKLMKHARPKITQHATVLDTLTLARKMHPGQRNSLDALCKRYEVDASKRDVHGALIDAELLARVYLAMTGGQTALSLDEEIKEATAQKEATVASGSAVALDLVIISASADEIAAHEALVEKIRQNV